MNALFVRSVAAARAAQLSSFSSLCERRAGRTFATAESLHAFSVEDPRRFWRLFLEWSALRVSGDVEPVCEGDDVETATFFPRLRLSFVENLLSGDPARPAVTAVREDGRVRRWSRGELTDRALSVAQALEAAGVRPGDRVAAVAASTEETVAACLGAVAIGATWSSVSTDLGGPAIASRLAPLEPKVLFFHGHARDGGVVSDLGAKMAAAAASLPSLTRLVAMGEPSSVRDPRLVPMQSLLAERPRRALADLPRFPWNHPLTIAFSSGTTGRPKCIVHGAGGTLLEQHKEHRLHADLGPNDKLYFHTNPGWMMWNWLVAALAAGTEIVLYEGSATHPRPDALWDLVGREKVTVFGTSPAFLQYSRDAGLVPGRDHDVSALRAVMSTGSVLKDALFEWVTDSVKRVPVQSISGGTDIMGCFLLGHPWLPVHAGELQSKSLGLDVGVAGGGLTGELVCRNPFPSRPLGLHGDPGGKRFHESYFSQHPGIWTHGDLLELTPSGGARVHGRTDGVLNVRGVRVGPAEIYAALEPIDEVVDAMALEQRLPGDGGGSRFVLLVVLRPGVTLDRDLRARIRRTLAERGSPAHVPEVIADVPELVRTHNGKKAERAGRDALNGDPVENEDALANPHVLAALRQHPALARADGPGDAASGDLVERVRAIWQEVFDGEAVTAQDDFHDLGGHSLLAITILLKVKAALGRQLPMGVFLGEGTTPAGMAALLGQPSSEGADRCLVALRAAGTKRPVVWLPGGGGLSTMAFRELSLLLGDDRPVYGLEAPMTRGEEPAETTLEETAAGYVRELRAAFPGPYTLFGFSHGAFMAFEVACQLEEAGERVSPLVLFDADVPVEPGALDAAQALAYRLGYHARRLGADPWRHARFLAAEAGKRLSSLNPSREPAPPAEELFDALNRRNLEALERYRSRPLRLFPGRITLVLATDTSKSGLPPDLDPRLAWRFHAQGGVDVHRVSGSHLSILREPHATELAVVLRECIDGADRQTPVTARPSPHHPWPVALTPPDRFHYTVRLDHFRKENAALGPRAGDRLILFGDSHVERFDVGWFPGRDVVNRGIAADHLEAHGPIGLLHRFHEAVLGPDPSHVFVMIGVNDLASGATVTHCIARYDALLAALEREYPSAIVVCHTVPPTRGRYDYLNGSILHLNRAIGRLANRHARVVDLHARLHEGGRRIAARYSDDGLHLGKKGYAVWSDAIHEVMGWRTGGWSPATWLELAGRRAANRLQRRAGSVTAVQT